VVAAWFYYSGGVEEVDVFVAFADEFFVGFHDDFVEGIGVVGAFEGFMGEVDSCHQDDGDIWFCGSEDGDEFFVSLIHDVDVHVCDGIDDVAGGVYFGDELSEFGFTTAGTGETQIYDLGI
jgi:hypothetical protein